MEQQEISKLASELTLKLDVDTPHRLMQQMAVSESWLARVAVEKRKLERELADLKNKQYPSSGTVEERKIRLESAVSELAQHFGLLKDLEKQLFTRLSLGQSFLKYHAEELKRLGVSQ